MSHKSGGKAVNTQMGGGFPGTGQRGVGHIGGHPLVTKVDLGAKPASKITPTQTAGNNTRPPREGTVQNRYGRNST